MTSAVQESKLKIAIFFSTISWLIFIMAGFQGFHFWYGGFLIFFWLSLGLWNYFHRTSLWLLRNNFLNFLKFYVPFAIFLAFLDLTGQGYTLWYYPFYYSIGFIWVYLVLYPWSGLGLLELIYFLSEIFGEKLIFIQRGLTRWHRFIDFLENLMFVVIIMATLSAALGWMPSLLVFFEIYIAWIILMAVKLKFHIRHWLHYILIIALASAIAVLVNEVPNVNAFEWVYLKAPFLNQIIWGVPLWAALGWFWFTFFVLRLWIPLVLHPKQT